MTVDEHAPGRPPDAGHAAAVASRSSQPESALRRTLWLAAILAGAAVLVDQRVLASWSVASSVRLPWWLLAILFALAEVMVFHVEVRQEAITFSFSELPLGLGLFFASPLALVLARTIGAVVVLVAHERQPLRKVALNAASFLAEATVAVAVFRALSWSHDPTRPMAWLAALVSLAAGQAITFCVVVLAMHWHGAPTQVRRMVVTNVATVLTNTALACLAAVLLVRSSAALGLLGFVAMAVVVIYRSYSALRQRYSSLELLYDFTRLVSGSQRPDEVLASMLNEARRLLRADAAALVVPGAEGTTWHWSTSPSRAALAKDPSVDAVFAVSTVDTATVVERSSRSPEGRALLVALRAKDAIVAPLIEGDRVLAVLLVVDRETDVSTFDTEDGRLFHTLANHAGVALRNSQLIERLHQQALQREHDALHDSLTRLPNRACFLAELGRAIAHAAANGGRVEVALLDLDRFKEINDTLGHHYGDLLLAQVAARLRARVPADVLVVRLGGDEFALISAGLVATTLGDLGGTIQAALAEPVAVEGLSLSVDASIGIARYPEHGADPSTLVQRADVAMYEAKTSAVDRIEIYRPERDSNTPRRLALANDLGRAIEHGELQLHYQPKVRLHDRTIGGVEGLVRWYHPVHGNIPPDEFVPLAERTGLIQPFTKYVIELGLRTLATWHERGLPLAMSLNLSVRNLLDTALASYTGELLDATGVAPSFLTFEVTETAVMNEPTKATKTLHDLAALGVKLSIDDFGTGQSSLTYLQQLPVDEVKIDRSFIMPVARTSRSTAIVRAVIDLAHSLELTVVAEGVEDEPTWTRLDELGCDEIQGYYLSRPLPPAELLAWLASLGSSSLALAPSRSVDATGPRVWSPR
jgi:diguanylate cyclase (GGDEF)-like protein